MGRNSLFWAPFRVFAAAVSLKKIGPESSRETLLIYKEAKKACGIAKRES
jgi:hypothetical protein